MIELPCWGAVAEFLSLAEMLDLRLVCKDWQRGLESGISMERCAQELSTVLKKRNVFLFQSSQGVVDTSWKTGATQDDVKASLLHPKSGVGDPVNLQTTGCVSRLIQLIRVILTLPESMVVAFSAKNGRHCFPIQWEEQKKEACLVTFPNCQRLNCSTCNLRPSPLVRHESRSIFGDAIDHNLEMRDEHGAIDLTEYIPKCIPNLPPDLTCPVCQVRDRRTLVLAEFSYRAAHLPKGMAPNLVPLTWTPALLDDEKVHTNKDTVDERTSWNEEGNGPVSPQNKRSRLDGRGSPPAFPPRYADMAIPIRHIPLTLPNDCKYGISIHCSACHEFAIWAPATVCWSLMFSCHERGRHLADGTILGGVLVRTKCSAPGCDRAIACPHCSHQNYHSPYGGDDSQLEEIRHPSYCGVCKQAYCVEHAWICTVCHHW